MKTLITLMLSVFICTGIYAGDRLEKIITVENSETLFTMFSFITIAKYEAADTINLTFVHRSVWRHLNNTLDDDYKNFLKKEFSPYNDHMFEYWATLFCLNCTKPPEIISCMDDLEEYNKKNNCVVSLNEMRAIEPILPLLNEFYRKAFIGELFKEYSASYFIASKKYLSGSLKEVRKVLEYLRFNEAVLDNFQIIRIIPNLIGPRGSAMGPVFKGIKYDIESPYENDPDSISVSPHEYIHDMVKHLIRKPELQPQINLIVEKVWNSIQATPAYKYYQEKTAFFEECLVRTIDYRTGCINYETAYKSLVKYQHSRGFVLTIPMLAALKEFENNGKPFDSSFENFLIALESEMNQKGRQSSQ